MPYEVSIFDPRTMGRLVSRMPPVRTFFRDTFFRHTETFATDACCYHGVDFSEFPVGHFLACCVEEVVCNLIEQLTLVGDSFGEHYIKSRNTVGGNHYENIAFD